MKKLTVVTEPFHMTFFLYNRYTKRKFGPFNSINEAKAFRYENFRGYRCFRIFSDTRELSRDEAYHVWLSGLRRSVGDPYTRPFCIVTFLGDVVPLSEIFVDTYKDTRNKESIQKKEDAIDKAKVKRKGDGNKIKASWATVYRYNNYQKAFDYVTPYLRYFRRMRTTAERRANEACEVEYGPGLVRKSRLGRSLTKAWDDVPCGVFKCSASWKHHSKRKKQWTPNTES